MMIRALLMLLFMVPAYSVFSQNTVVEIRIEDKNSKTGIHNATIKVSSGDSTIQRISSDQGLSWFDLNKGQEYMIEVYHGYYASETDRIRISKNTEDTLRKKISLSPVKVRTIEEVTVLAPGSTTVVYQSEQLSVADFDVLPSGDLLLLLYPKTLAKGGELMIFSNNNSTTPFKIKENPKELIRDYRGNVHVVCENGVYGIYQQENNTIGIAVIDKEYYMKYIFPIVDTIETKSYFSNFSDIYPAFDYFAYDTADSTYKKIMQIKDDLMMELYRSEFKWVDVRTKMWAHQKQLDTGIDKEIWVGAAYFTSSIYYKELYAPMFRKEDKIYVFDYYKDLMFVFNQDGEKTDSVAIYHHYEPKKTGWKKKLIQDPQTGNIYAFYEKGGICSLRKINLQTGEPEAKITLSHPYVDKIAVINGSAYYIYRPYESAQKRFLYQSKLPYETNITQ